MFVTCTLVLMDPNITLNVTHYLVAISGININVILQRIFLRHGQGNSNNNNDNNNNNNNDNNNR